MDLKMNDQIVNILLEELRQTNRNHAESMSKVAGAVEKLNDTNLIHNETLTGVRTVLEANTRVIEAFIESSKERTKLDKEIKNGTTRFYQFIIILLIIVIIVAAELAQAFKYIPLFKAFM